MIGITGSGSWSPFDPLAIVDLWGSKTDGDSNAESPSQMSKHFLDKTFQITFRVPPIILSEWQEYLIEQLALAMPKHKRDELYLVSRVYDALVGSKQELPTPRSLKLFVNSVGALHRQWQDTLPLTFMAAFVLVVDNPEIQMIQLLRANESDNLANPVRSIFYALDGTLGSGWHRNLAALYFNVDPAIAYQILLAAPIRTALLTQRNDDLSILASNPGFPDVVVRVVVEFCGTAKSHSHEFARVVATFSHLPMTIPTVVYCKNEMYKTSQTIDSWEPFDETVAVALAYLLDMASDVQQTARLVASVARSSWDRGAPPMPSAPTQWCMGVAYLLPLLVKHDWLSVSEYFRVSGDAGQYVQAIKAARTLDSFEGLWKYMQPSADKGSIVMTLKSGVEAGKWSEEDGSLIVTLTLIAGDWEWTPLIAGLQNRMALAAQGAQNDAPHILDSLLFLSGRVATAKERLMSAAANQELFRVIYFLRQQNLVNGGASTILPILTSNLNLSQSIPATQGNTPPWYADQGRQYLLALIQNPKTNESLFSQMASRCLVWMSCGKWRAITESKVDRKILIDGMLGEALRDKGNWVELNAEEIITHYAYWENILDKTSFQSLLVDKAEHNEFATELMKRDFDVKDESLYSIALDFGKNPDYRQWIKANIEQVTQAQWQSAMFAETKLLDIVLAMKPEAIQLGQEFLDALMWHAEQKLAQSSAPGRLAGSWEELLSILNSDEQNVFDQFLTNKMLGSHEGRFSGLIPYYGTSLSCIIIEDGPEKFLARVDQIIEGQSVLEVDWLFGVLSGWKPVGSKLTSVQASWKKRAESSLKGEESSDMQTALQRLILALSV